MNLDLVRNLKRERLHAIIFNALTEYTHGVEPHVYFSKRELITRNILVLIDTELKALSEN